MTSKVSAEANSHGLADGDSPKEKRKGGKRGRKPGGLVDYAEVLPHFREATWEEALDLVARRLSEIYLASGPPAIAGFGSAKCSNEEAYLFQKLIRTGFHTNNVDHCTRLCHASSVSALFEGIGSGAVSTTYGDVINAEVAIVTGSNSTANHPVASSFFKQARRKGTTIIYIDPRADKMADHADIYCQLKPGTDVAFYNGVMHEVIRLGLTDAAYIATRTSNYEALARTVADYPPERAEQITGVPADLIRRVARAWGEARSGVIFWGMGISQHTTGTDNARCLIALCAITGNIGKPGAGLHPLRGQNNVQGASDMGLVPMFYPDYQKADDPGVKQRFEQAWGTADLDPVKGLTVTEIIGSALKGGVRGMYMLGENPFLSDPNINKVRKALAKLDFLVVQDIFLTETAEFADVILPASSYLEKDGTYTNTDRRVQLGHKVLDTPGQARVDWEVVQDIANRVGLDWRYASPRDIFEEMVSVIPSYKNLSYDNLGLTGKLYPNPDPEHSDGTVVMFTERFKTDDGLAHLVPAEWLPAKELPDAEYPFVLNTGRMLEHWHTGSMTRRSYALDAISPRALVFLHPDDAAQLGLDDGAMARVSSRRGTIELAVKVSHREARGNCFIPFHFREAAANLLTIDEIDPFGKIPEFKFCAVKIALSPPMAEAPARVPGVEARAGKFPGPSLIPALNAIQERVGWLPREELVTLSRDVRRPLYEIEGLVSFYPHFRTEAQKKVELRVCHDLSCWLRGADERIARLRQRYGADAEVELVEGSCIGRCDIAPACTVNEAPVPMGAADAAVAAARDAATPHGPAAARTGTAPITRPRRRPRASPGRTTRTRPRPTATRSCARCWPGWTPPTSSPRSRTPACAAWAGPASGRPQVGPGGGAGIRPEVRDLQRGRVRAGDVQGPGDPRHPALPGPGGNAARHARGRRRGRLGVHPARVRPRGAGDPRGDRVAPGRRPHRP